MHNKKNKNKEKNLQIHYRECITYSLVVYSCSAARILVCG